MVTVPRHQKSFSVDGDMEVFPYFVANLHYVGILYLVGDKKILMVTVTANLHHLWILHLGDAVTRRHGAAVHTMNPNVFHLKVYINIGYVIQYI